MPFEFAQPSWLYLAVPVCAALAALMWRAQRKRRAALAELAGAQVSTTVSEPVRRVRDALALTAVALCFVAAARPYAGYRVETTPSSGADVMFAVDTSKSMRATDVKPNRLTRAKLAVADLQRAFEGERVGLVAFAGGAFVQAPLTADRGAFLEAVDALDTSVIPRGGSDLASAIRAGAQALGASAEHPKVLVLLSDGEDLAGDAVDAAREAGKQGLVIYTLGVGTPAGELIESGSGEVVRSRLDEATLRAVAQATGGDYVGLGADGRGVEALYAAAKAKLPSASLRVEQHKVLEERFYVPLAAALACLLIELLLSERRRRRWLPGRAAAAGLMIAVVPGVSQAATPQGAATYNEGTERYRSGDFAGAREKFEAALRGGDLQLQVDGYYDLGNTKYRLGEASLQKDRDAAIAAWREALEAYDGALALSPGDADAKFNREFVARKLAELEEQKRQEQSQAGGGQQQQQQGGQQQQAGQQQGGSQQDQHGPQHASQQQGGEASEQQKTPSGEPSQQQHGGASEGKPGDAQSAQQARGQGPQQAPDAAASAQARGERRPTPPDALQAAGAASAGEPGEEQAAARAMADARRRAAGELTQMEAEQLLDSRASELQPLPIHGRGKADERRTSMKDW